MISPPISIQKNVSGLEQSRSPLLFLELLIYYSTYKRKNNRRLGFVKSQAFFIRGRRGKMIINPIKKRREEKGLTQVDLALLVGVSQIYISQFETGGLVPSDIHVKNITEILGISPETLNKELHQFYEDRRKELKKRMEERQDNA